MLTRRGDKKATVAAAHGIFVIACHLLRDGTHYADLGGQYFDRLNTARFTRYHSRRLSELGYRVTLTNRPREPERSGIFVGSTT